MIIRGYFEEFLHFVVGSLVVIGRLLRLAALYTVFWLSALIVAGALHHFVMSYWVVNMSVYLSICTEEEHRGVLRFCEQEVLKVLKCTSFYELSMETTHCHGEVYVSG